MKNRNRMENTAACRQEQPGRLGRKAVALLLALIMVFTSLPFGGEVFSAYAEAGGTEAAAAEPTQGPAIEPVTTAAPVTTTTPEAVTNVPAEATTATTAESASAAQAAPASDADAQKHICVIRSFADNIPGEPLDTISVRKGSSLGKVKALLPQKLEAVLECDECPTAVKAKWKSVGADRFVLAPDEELYIYAPLDDPGTRDIDESKDSPYCDLPFISVIIEGGETQVSPTDVSGSDLSAPEVSGSDVSASDVVSGADVSGTDVSGTDGSGTDGSDTDGSAGGRKPAAGKVSGSDVSGSDAAPVCICEKHCYADPAEGVYSVNVLCAVCSADPSACEVLPELEERMLTAAADDGRTVTVSGPLPEGALLRVLPLSGEEQEAVIRQAGLIGQARVHFAYDITIVYEGCEYQPVDFGSSVRVTVSDVRLAEGEGIAVYHVAENGLERVDARVEEGSVTSFETDSFSDYVALSSDISTIYFSNNAFYADAALNQQLAKDGTPYTAISDIIADTTGSLTFIMKSPYVVSRSETIDPGSRTVIIRNDSGYTQYLINLPAGSGHTLTLGGNVIIDGANISTGSYLVEVRSGSKLVMKDNAIVRNGAAGGIRVYDGGSFDMYGGTITGNKVVNGAGIYNGGTFTMYGGVISGNSAEHSGGGIWQTGIMIMHGGQIINNTAQSVHAGGIMAYGGETTIGGGTISGNTCAQSPSSNGVCVYNEQRVFFTLGGTPRIDDNVCVISNSFGNMVGVNTPFDPLSAIKLAGSVNNQTVACYAANIPATELSKFDTVNPGQVLKISGSTILVSNAGQAYYGSDKGSNPDAKTPYSWKLRMDFGYGVLANNGGTLFMSDAFSVNTSGNGVTVYGTRYKAGSLTKNISNGGKVVLKRWQKPDGLTGNNVNGTYYGELLASVKNVSNSTTGVLHLQNIVLDGSNRPYSYTYSGTTYQLGGVSSAANASLVVRGGSRTELEGDVVLRDAPPSPYGGAINVDNGTLNIRGSVTFSNNKANTYGRAIYVKDSGSVVNIYTSEISNPEGEDIYLASSSSKLNIHTNLSTVLPITINPNDTASCKAGRVIATYANGYTPNPASFDVINVDCKLIRDGQNIIIAPYTGELTAHADTVTPDAGESRTFTIDLASMYGSLSNIMNKNVTVSNVTLASGSINLLDYQTVEADKATYGCSESNTNFGISATLNTGAGSVTQDIRNTSAMAVGSSATKAELVLTVHNGNAITVDDRLATITLDLNVGGSVRSYTITLYAHSGFQIEVAVPLRITGVVDSMGEVFLPDAQEYRITNSGSVPVVLTDVEWEWIVGSAYDADELFAEHENISMSLNLGSAGSFDFGGSEGYDETGVDALIPAHDGSAPGSLGLDWTMELGAGSYVKNKTGATVANITYSIDVKE